MVYIAEIKVGLYCNRKASGLRDCVLIQRNCIVTQQLGQWLDGRSVSQYTCCIVARKGLRQGCIARQPRTRRLRPRDGAGRAHDTVPYACNMARVSATTRRWAGHDTAARAQPCKRLGAPVRTWVCQFSQLGARAPGLVFRLGFRLGDVFESPFGPGS